MVPAAPACLVGYAALGSGCFRRIVARKRFAMNRRSGGTVLVTTMPARFICDGCGTEYTLASEASPSIYFGDGEWIDFHDVNCFDVVMTTRRGVLHDGRVVTLSRDTFRYGLCLPLRA
jgi:hypothetical protein